jgi:transmembrane sensor
MHHGSDVRAPADPAGELPIVERNVAREAARWLMRLSSGRATDADVNACDQWRASKAEHEYAWQRAQRVNARFGLIPSALGMATLNRPDLKSRRAALKTLVALVVAGPVGWAAWRADPLGWSADYRSAAGERRDVMLADGSTLHLNTSSAVDVLFDDAARLLRLRAGEIAVNAVADPASQPRPFIVRTRLGDIEAQASRFCVRQERERCLLSVQEGSVRVSSGAQPDRYVSVSAGEQRSLSTDGIAAPAPADPHASDWLRGVLYASALQLDAFAAELGRYRPGILRCDPEIAHLRISGAFQLHDTDAVLAALPATLPVQVRYRTQYWVTIAPRAAAA